MDNSLVTSIPSENESPVTSRGGYDLGAVSLGKLERLAKSGLDFRPFAEGVEFDREPAIGSSDSLDLVATFSGSQLTTITQSVVASSEIEGEHFHRDYVSQFVTGLADDFPVTDGNGDLHRSFKDQVETYFWLLEGSAETPLSVELIQEIHRRMFQNHPEMRSQAGQLKQNPVQIRYVDSSKVERIVQTIPVTKTESFLEAACDLFNRNYLLSRENAHYSTLVAAAEFHCDFLAIHPFSDGIGRVARLLSVYLLHRAGYKFTYLYPFDQVILDRRHDYYRSLFRAQQNWHSEQEDLSGWVKFYISAVYEQFERALRRVRDANDAA